MMEEIEKVWLTHIPKFPFKMSVGIDVSQFTITSEKQFLKFVYDNLSKDIYVAVRNLEDYQNKIYRTFFIDIDSKDIPKAYEDFKSFCRVLQETEIKFRPYFSGSKGFAIYIDFKPFQIIDGRRKISEFVDRIVEVMGYDYFDRGVCIDIRRVSRLPYTINTKSMKMCHPIPIDKIYDLEIKNLGKVSQIISIEKDFTTEIIRDIFKEIIIDEEPKQFKKDKNNYQNELETILNKKKQLIDGVRHHAIRLKIIPSLIKMGYTDEHIENICIDYYNEVFGGYSSSDKSWVYSQIRGLRNKKLQPISLRNFGLRYGKNGSIFR